MLSVKQAYVHDLNSEDFTRMSLPSVYFRYSLESHRPSETNMHAMSSEGFNPYEVSEP